jgi:hypothetical protein
MTIGAPDHVRLSDDAHSRYTWKRLVEASIAAADGVLYTLIDQAFEGVLVSFSSRCVYNETRYLIYVDDIEIQDIRPKTLWDSHMFRKPDSSFDITGLSVYDEINNKFNIWFYTHFKCYVKKSVKVTGWQDSGVVKQILYPMIYYLERD